MLNEDISTIELVLNTLAVSVLGYCVADAGRNAMVRYALAAAATVAVVALINPAVVLIPSKNAMPPPVEVFTVC